MRVLLLTIGSHGDVHPFIGLGLALRARGHSITFATNDYFAPLVRRAGFDDFIALGSADEYEQMAQMPELWEHKRGIKMIFEHVGRGLSQVYDVAAAHHAIDPNDCAVVSSSLCLGARVAQDQLHFPMATIHLAPSLIRSVINPAKLPGLSMPPWMPHWSRRALWHWIDRIAIDPIVCPTLNEFRKTKNLPPLRRPLKDWWHSPDRMLGFWPDWFAPVQSDWPSQTRLCGFPLYDEKGLDPMPQALLEFLAAGDKPIAFTPGSAMWRGEKFFAAAVDLCQRLGRRGILLSRSKGHIPRKMPANMIHIRYAPFSELLPRVAALVHHGGIGTTSQALAAGVPQMIVAMSHDQPDNGHRIQKLGVGVVTTPKKFYATSNSARELTMLLDPVEVLARCEAVARRFDGKETFRDAIHWIEALRASDTSPA